MEKSLVEGSESAVFRKYLVPSMLSMLAVSAYSFVDTFVVGQGIGADAVAAMGLGTPVVSFPIGEAAAAVISACLYLAEQGKAPGSGRKMP